MSRLRDIQASFMHDIYQQDQTSAPYLNLAKNGSIERINIYANNLRLGLCQSLSNIYPVVEQLVGNAFFEQVSKQYVQNYRLHQANRNLYGHQLSAFLKSIPALKDMPYIAEVAEIEWAYFQASIAENAPALDFQQLQHAINQTDYVLKPHPSTRCVYTTYNSVDIWRQHQRESIETMELVTSDQYWLIWRDPHHELLLKPVPKLIIELLEQSQLGQPFSEFMASIEEQNTLDTLQTSFADAVAHGAFSSE